MDVLTDNVFKIYFLYLVWVSRSICFGEITGYHSVNFDSNVLAAMKVAGTYACLSIVAIVVNICSQAMVLLWFDGLYSLSYSLAVGAVAGLITKYLLDKRYVFRFQVAEVRNNTKTFILYCLVGVFTTALFLIVELFFNHMFKSDLMRYLGGVLGLSMGYALKYQLDKRFVFVR